VKRQLTEAQASEVEDEMRQLLANPCVTKDAIRLFMQHPMPCGHAAGNLLMCDSPPFGCVICNDAPLFVDVARAAEEGA
jgi:hypothetical protein